MFATDFIRRPLIISEPVAGVLTEYDMEDDPRLRDTTTAHGFIPDWSVHNAEELRYIGLMKSGLSLSREAKAKVPFAAVEPPYREEVVRNLDQYERPPRLEAEAGGIPNMTRLLALSETGAIRRPRRGDAFYTTDEEKILYESVGTDISEDIPPPAVRDPELLPWLNGTGAQVNYPDPEINIFNYSLV